MFDNRAMPSSMMSVFPTSARSVSRALSAIVFASLAVTAFAQTAPEPGSLRERYPTSSIDSAERADAALAETNGAKAHVELEYRNQARDCMKGFTVNACLDGARALQRKRLADIDGVELEANRFKRRDKADRLDADRQKRDAEHAANAPADADQRARNRKSYEDRQAQAAREVAERKRTEARTAANPSKPHRPAVKVPPPADTAANAAMREKNAAQHAAKVREANAHLAEIDRRMVSKTAERKRHAEEKAVKEAKAAAVEAAAAANVAKP